jgi:hypothetical protein
MSVYLYDESLVSKIRKVYTNTVMATDDTMLEEAAKAAGGDVKLPVIVVERLGWRFDSDNYNNPAIFQGRGRYYGSSGEIVQFPTIPITIQYQMNVIGDRRFDVDQLSSELLFFLLKKPIVKFKMTKPVEWISTAATLKVEDVNEESDYTGFTDKGKMYRTMFDLTLTNASIMQLSEVSRIETVVIDFILLDE